MTASSAPRCTALDAARIDRDRGTGKLFVFHDLRHTFGTLAVQAFPLSDVQGHMRHADVATTMIYVHHTPQHAAADRLGQFIATDLDAGGTLAAGIGEAP
jgi:integrase